MDIHTRGAGHTGSGGPFSPDATADSGAGSAEGLFSRLEN